MTISYEREKERGFRNCQKSHYKLYTLHHSLNNIDFIFNFKRHDILVILSIEKHTLLRIKIQATI